MSTNPGPSIVYIRRPKSPDPTPSFLVIATETDAHQWYCEIFNRANNVEEVLHTTDTVPTEVEAQILAKTWMHPYLNGDQVLV